jgi:hypothetical protein
VHNFTIGGLEVRHHSGFLASSRGVRCLEERTRFTLKRPEGESPENGPDGAIGSEEFQSDFRASRINFQAFQELIETILILT